MHVATALAAVNLACQDVAQSVRFYKAIGVEVRETKLLGVVSYSCALAGVHFALRPLEPGRTPGAGAQLAFMISNLDGALEAVAAAGGTVVEKASPRPWGMTAVVEDPDGRRIELVSTKVEMTGPMPF